MIEAVVIGGWMGAGIISCTRRRSDANLVVAREDQ
jgi:hypothetical protein